jgi:hypothetical protein
MRRKTVLIFSLSVLLLLRGMQARAETSPESVTVTAARSHEVVARFAKAFATPTEITGKIARWERGVCPIVVGQDPHYAAFITQHIKYVALAAGAPVNTEPSCAPNIEIVFTTTPQALLDSVRKNDRDYLGYATSSARQNALAVVTRPIQAWYTTETVDVNGARSVDSGMPLGEGIRVFSRMDPPLFVRQVARWNGRRINDGIHSGFNHVLIVVDSTKLAGREIVPLADYVSMLALTQINSPDACQELPSIVNMLAANCDRAAESLTQFDLAYLESLYHVTTGRKMRLQLGEVSDLMTDRLEKADTPK